MGRVAGISGIAANALTPAQDAPAHEKVWRWAFLLGLVGMGAVTTNYMHVPVIATRPYVLLVVAVCWLVLAPFLCAGCTSDGVCGIGRRSVRTLVATLVFMGTGIVTATATVLIASLLTDTPTGA